MAANCRQGLFAGRAGGPAATRNPPVWRPGDSAAPGLSLQSAHEPARTAALACCRLRHRPSPAVHGAGAVLRRLHRHHVDGHPPRLRPVAAAHHHGAGLVARDLRLRAGDPEPGLGPGRAGGRWPGRPLWRLQGADRGQPVLCRRAGADGPVHLGPGLHRQRGLVAGHGPVGHHLRGGLRGDRSPGRAGADAAGPWA